MSAEIKAIARAWMEYLGYTASQIEQAEIQSHTDACGGEWDCTLEDGTPRHPILDALNEACQMANVAIETLESIGALK